MAYSLMFSLLCLITMSIIQIIFLSLQKVLLEIQHATQLKAEMNRTTEMVSKRLHVTAAWIEEKFNFQKVKDAQLLSSNE